MPTSDSEDDYDITKSIAINPDVGSSDEGGSDFEGFGDEVQDEILSSSEEEEEEDDKSFPTMELSDNEEDEKKDEQIDEYFSTPKVKKGSDRTFAGLGLSKILVQNVSRKGFKMPTPIQRKTMPLVLDGKDVVGMARTGSGKTAAFVLPMLEKLKVHSARVGARALILAPNRELALQTLKVVKEFSRGSDLRSVLLVGGDSLEDQFGYMMGNPDIIIATPGRFMHLKVEMQLDISTIEYVVFDEADRLFELGFSEQLNEILASLSTARQTLLFSATLPNSLVEFAKAGLNDPVLVRLDAETKVSEDLEMAFFSIKDDERDAALCYVLKDVIKMPLASEEQRKYLQEQEQRYLEEASSDEDNNNKSKKRNKKKKKFKKERLPKANELPCPESTIVFVPTKYHVEYISSLLMTFGYAVSFIYGTLDQTARKEQLFRFRAGKTSVLVVTDVAARGIDIPVLANVVNYTLPPSPKVFVHRVGRTARAGRRGWAYSLIKKMEVPYLLDLELFLGRKLQLTPQNNTTDPKDVNFTERMVVGGLPRAGVEDSMEEVESLIKNNYDVSNLRDVALRGEKQYINTRPSASQESMKRSKDVIEDGWDRRNLLFGPSVENEQQQLLDALSNRKTKETIFEYRKQTFESAAEMMAKRRRQLAPIQRRAEEKRARKHEEAANKDNTEEEQTEVGNGAADLTEASESTIKAAFKEASDDQPSKKKRKTYKDDNFFMSHFASSDAAAERGYSLNNGSGSFAGDARSAAFDITGEGKEFAQKQGMRWDKKKGKYINASSTDSKGKDVKYIRGENGQKIPASFRSGRFDAWKASHKASVPRVGTIETSSAKNNLPQGKRYKYNDVKAPKPADKARDDYESRKKRVKEALDKGLHVKGMRPTVAQSTGVQDTEAVRKQRKLKEKRREKNARPSHRKKK
ncbi:hypothetical protein TRICI_006585 [Trichomonascus ciferrii]|uniref:ATP-dependent RNA helicase DBP10 n=1 Tax=Trichomonascus ciferrii TaxID=44093 RepID=A0A642UIG6_9ASCO|nr:hypothetical protein TRICI_006585 [Trichomonascus ciferrii]